MNNSVNKVIETFWQPVLPYSSKKNKSTVETFKKKVLEIEGFNISVPLSYDTEVPEYIYKRRSPGSMTVGEWLRFRAKTFIKLENMTILDNNNNVCKPSEYLGFVRFSYLNKKQLVS